MDNRDHKDLQEPEEMFSHVPERRKPETFPQKFQKACSNMGEKLKTGWASLTDSVKEFWEDKVLPVFKKGAEKKPKAPKPKENKTVGSSLPAEKKYPAEKRAERPAAVQEKDPDALRNGSAAFVGGAGQVIRMVAVWSYRLRSVLLAIPVVVAAITLAIRNMAILPEAVGLNLLASGEYQFVVAKSVAVLGPLAVTAVCLLLMFTSRKVLYPWLISIFSLVLPLLIWITNVFPS